MPLKGKGSKLSNKMKTFVDEYMVDLNAVAACRRSAYIAKRPEHLAVELMEHPLIIAEIASRMKDRQEKTELTADYIINKLITIVEATDASNPTAALRGLELLGKTLGIYRDKQEVSGPNGNPIEYEQRIREDNSALESAIARLADNGGKGNVVSLPVRTAKG